MGGVLFLLIVVALIVYMTFVQTQARRQTSITTPLGRIAVQEVIESNFGSTWARVNGPGHVNVKPKFRHGSPIISIDVDGGTGGGSSVDIWMSHWTSRYGLVGHAHLVWRKKRVLAQRLQQGVSTTMAAPSTGLGAPPSPGSGPRAGSASAPPAGGRKTALVTPGTSAAVLKTVEQSDMNLLVRSTQPPEELVRTLRRTVAGTQQGSDSHLLVGPPRATMWIHCERLRSGETLMMLSLMTRDNPNRLFVTDEVQAPLSSAMAKLGATVELVAGQALSASVRNDILAGDVVPLAKLST